MPCASLYRPRCLAILFHIVCSHAARSSHASLHTHIVLAPPPSSHIAFPHLVSFCRSVRASACSLSSSRSDTSRLDRSSSSPNCPSGSSPRRQPRTVAEMAKAR
eukprot:4937188-Pleurochrysis_carterae.AAC.1